MSYCHVLVPLRSDRLEIHVTYMFLNKIKNKINWYVFTSLIEMLQKEKQVETLRDFEFLDRVHHLFFF